MSVDILTLIVLCMTLTVLCWYTVETYRLRKAAQQQNLENTFFQLLRFHKEIVESTKYNGAEGRLAFGRLYLKFSEHYDNINASKSSQERIVEACSTLHQNVRSDVGHYFRNLYHILKFVRDSNLEDKKLYAQLLRAQLSSRELLLLFYYCLSDLGRKRFKPLVECFAIFEHLPGEELRDPKDVELYDRQAFGEGDSMNTTITR